MEQLFKHQNEKSRLLIKKQVGSIAVCEKIDEAQEFNIHGELVFPICIVQLKNIEPIK